MRMTVAEFLELWADGEHEDIDVYDNVCEELAIAYCGTQLTEAGKEQFKEVLEYEIEVDTDPRWAQATVDVDEAEGVWQHKLAQASALFYSMAGYCKDTDWNKWFIMN